jgi:Pectate lyase superfamily protein
VGESLAGPPSRTHSRRRARRVVLGIAMATLVVALAAKLHERPGPLPHQQPPAAADVRVVGAKGDGVTDDAPAIQRAIDQAAAGDTVTLPPGTYMVRSTIDLHSGVTLAGTPGQSTLVMPAQAKTAFILAGSGLRDVTLRGLSFSSSGFDSEVGGVYMVGAIDCRARDLRFDRLQYALKLGSGPPSRGWIVEGVQARECATTIYAADIADSRFARLDLQGAQTGRTLDHDIYLESNCHGLTFTDVTLTGGSGYCLQLYVGPGGASSDVTFERTLLDATTGRYPLVIGSGWSKVAFGDLDLTMSRTDGPCVLLGAATDITFDGFTASGGRSLLEWYGDRAHPAERITLKNGRYDGPALPTGAAGIADLLVQNVTVGATTGAPTS